MGFGAISAIMAPQLSLWGPALMTRKHGEANLQALDFNLCRKQFLRNPKSLNHLNLFIKLVVHKTHSRLVIPNGAYGKYVAFTYCWGSTSTSTPQLALLRTERGNLQDHLVSIPMEKLPQTLQDAVLVMRKFGLQFLWIDSLCIVQDDLADWEEEAANMDAVYSNAYLTLAATSPISSH